MRLGIADHLGWAVAVTASEDHQVVDRRRIELAEPGISAAPIHYESRRLDVAATTALVASNALAREGGGVSINQFQSGGRQAANTALESDIDIPPTLRRNQAVPMTVFVARKLDFSGVYRLRAIQ